MNFILKNILQSPECATVSSEKQVSSSPTWLPPPLPLPEPPPLLLSNPSSRKEGVRAPVEGRYILDASYGAASDITPTKISSPVLPRDCPAGLFHVKG